MTADPVRPMTVDAEPAAGSTPTPLVSIVTPSLNQGEFIEDAIRSVREQDYPRIEHLVMDGGSTDGTLDILRGQGTAVRWTSGPDEGQADAINRGFAATSGEIIAWLNADDRYRPGAVSAAVAALLEPSRPALVYGNAGLIDSQGRAIGRCRQVEPWSLDRLIGVLDFVVQPASFFRRDAFLEVGGLDRGLRYCMDYDLWIKLGARYPVRFLPDELADVRLHGATKTATGGLARLLEVERMIARHGRRSLPISFQREAIETALAELAEDIRRARGPQAGRAARVAVEYGTRVIARKAGRLAGSRPAR